MPRLSRLYVKTAFVYLLFGFTVGALMLANKGRPLHPALWGWLSLHIEALLSGWIVQLTLGVAFWILPRFWQGPRRGNTTGVVIAYGLLNAGILLVMARTLWPELVWGTAVGRLLQLLAIVAFAHHAWPRIVGREG